MGGENSSDPQRIAIVGIGTEEYGSVPGGGSGVSRIEQGSTSVGETICLWR